MKRTHRRNTSKEKKKENKRFPYKRLYGRRDKCEKCDKEIPESTGECIFCDERGVKNNGRNNIRD